MRMQAKHSNVSSLIMMHALLVQFVFEERNEDASTQMFLRLIMMHAWCSLFLRKEMRMQSKHSNVFSFDHDAAMHGAVCF